MELLDGKVGFNIVQTKFMCEALIVQLFQYL